MSVSLLGTWWRCPRLFYWRYVHPMPDGQGVEPEKTSSPLLLGWLIHQGLAAWYRSDWRGGSYQLDAALAEIRKCANDRMGEFESEEVWERDLTKAEEMMREYHGWYGPAGTREDWPKLKVASGSVIQMESGPLIESTFRIPLGIGGYHLTVRPDAMVFHDGVLVCLEHKTTAAAGLSSLFAKMQMDAQAIGEMMVLTELFPDTVFGGVLVNALVKDRAKRSKLPAFDRELIHYPAPMIKSFKHEIRSAIHQIEDAVGGWQALVDKGLGPMEAAGLNFPMVGLFTGACHQWSRCSMHPICSAPGREKAGLGWYKARTYKEESSGTYIRPSEAGE